MERLSGRIYRFADVEVDSAQGLLIRGGRPHYLRPQTLQVLLYLLAHRRRIVPREELTEHIWGTTAVTPDALVQCVVDIRKVLGDDSRHPRLIKTIPRVGYRFIGQTEESFLDLTVSAEIEEIRSVEIEFEEDSATALHGEQNRLRKDGRQRLPSLLPSVKAVVFASARRTAGFLSVLTVLVALGLWGYIKLNSSGISAEVTLPQMPGKKGVAVMFFNNQVKDQELDWLREGLADMLITDLSRSPTLMVLSRGQLHLLFEKMGQRPLEEVRLDSALEIARRAKADALVLGGFTRLGEKVRIDVQVHDGHTGRMIAADGATADHLGQLLSQVELLAFKLSEHLGARATADERRNRLTDAMTNDLEAYRCYSLAIEKAEAYHSLEAIALLERAVARDPRFAMAYARLGYVYGLVRVGEAQKAKPYFEKAFRLSDRLTARDRHYISAWYAIANGDLTEAIASLGEIVADNPWETEAALRLGYLLRGQARFEDAAAIYRRALAMDPDRKEVWNALGFCYQAVFRNDDAIEAHRHYVCLAPNEPNAHDSLGMSLDAAGRYDEAMTEFGEALRLKPDFHFACLHLGDLYVRLGRYRDAFNQYQQFLRIAPSDWDRATGANRVVLLSLRSGDLQRAAAAADAERKYKTNYGGSYLVALARGDLQTARQLLPELLQHSYYSKSGTTPTEGQLEYFRGLFALRSGQMEQAIAHFRESARYPTELGMEGCRDRLADTYLQLGRLDEAIAEYQRLLTGNPNLPLALFHLGQAYDRKGQREQAQAAYERFLQVWKNADAERPEPSEAKQRRSVLAALTTSIPPRESKIP